MQKTLPPFAAALTPSFTTLHLNDPHVRTSPDRIAHHARNTPARHQDEQSLLLRIRAKITAISNILLDISPRTAPKSAENLLPTTVRHGPLIQSRRLGENLRLLFLPPYSPELNPQEHLWDELREKYFHNRAFDSLGALEDQLVAGLRALEVDHARVKSIAGWEYIINSISNAISNYTRNQRKNHHNQ